MYKRNKYYTNDRIHRPQTTAPVNEIDIRFIRVSAQMTNKLIIRIGTDIQDYIALTQDTEMFTWTSTATEHDEVQRTRTRRR